MHLNLALPVPDPSLGHLAETRPKYLQTWLERLPVANLHESAQALLLSLAAQNRQAIADDSRQKLLELYRVTVHTLTGAIKLQISDAALPLTEKQHQLATLARELLIELANGYKIVLQASSGRLLSFRSKPDQTQTMQRILSANSRLLTLCYEGYADVPTGLWSEIHQIYRYAVHQNAPDDIITDTPPASVSQLYRLCLLIATADPYRLTLGEVSKVLDLLRLYGDIAQTQPLTSPLQTNGLFLISPDKDQPPLPLFRYTGTTDPAHDYLFNTLELARRLHQLFNLLKSGKSAVQLGLPGYADEATYQGLLQRLIRNWGHEPTRHFNRRGGTDDGAELCTGIRAIHGFLLAAHSAPDNTQQGTFDPDEINISSISARGRNHRTDIIATHWIVTNDSASGLALHKRNSTSVNLKVGEVVAVHSHQLPLWNIGVVRWLRNSPADRIEFGLQMLSPNPQPVWIRNAIGRIRTNQPALLLPANPILQLPQQLLVPRGVYVPGIPLELSAATNSSILPGKVLEHTHNFDLFEFQEIS
ncbi:MAG: hypothetical protein ACYCZJ_00730 [Sulfuriferula sp.]